jgi:hypothetical protein
MGVLRQVSILLPLANRACLPLTMRDMQIDAWMFMAVAQRRRNGGRASLEDLIGVADWINHAIPIDEELIGGLNRLLIATGIVDERGDRSPSRQPAKRSSRVGDSHVAADRDRQTASVVE